MPNRILKVEVPEMAKKAHTKKAHPKKVAIE